MLLEDMFWEERNQPQEGKVSSCSLESRDVLSKIGGEYVTARI